MTTLTFNPPTPGPDAEADVLASVLRDDGVIELWEANFDGSTWWSSNATRILQPVVSWAHKPAGVDMRGGVAQPAAVGALPTITEDDRQFLHYNPNTSDLVKWVQAYARRAIAAAPAAEVPEAMGDAEITRLGQTLGQRIPGVSDYTVWPGMGYEKDAHGEYRIPSFPKVGIEFARRVIAARDAQWQSTRLRGGVPERAALVDELIRCAGRRDVLHAQHMGKAMTDDAYAEFTKLRDVRIPELRAQLTAAPQAPAPELDAGVVRELIAAWDACGRYPDTSADIERLDNAVNALRAAMSAQGGGK